MWIFSCVETWVEERENWSRFRCLKTYFGTRGAEGLVPSGPSCTRKDAQAKVGPGQSRLIEKTHLRVGVCLLKCSSTSATELGPLTERDDTGRNIFFYSSKNKICIISGLNGDRKGGHQLNKIHPRLLILNVKAFKLKKVQDPVWYALLERTRCI